ncbi:MAG TPA: hypothetical protein VH559_12100 [Gemmatimonadaceae bacterium]
MMKTLLILCSALVACSAAIHATPQPCRSNVDFGSLVNRPDLPRPLRLFAPPRPIPSSVRGSRATVRVVVDTVGRVFPDSVMVCGIADRHYLRTLADAVAALRFRPARLNGRWVVSPAVITYDF